MDTQIFPSSGRTRKQPLIIQQKRISRLPSLKSVLEEISPLPADNVLVGACEDGLPVFMDLAKPSAGSILIIADPCTGKTSLLFSILNSACITNPPRRLRVSYITRHPEQMEKIDEHPHLYKSSNKMGTPGELIDEITDLVHTRKVNGENTPAILLGIDGLVEISSTLSRIQVEHLGWLVKNGPSARVRVLATVETNQLPQLGDLLDCFGAHLIGKTKESGSGLAHAQVPEETVRALKPGVQFCAKFAEEWVPFWILS